METKTKYSISQIAEICGVSKATVSRVINNSPCGVGEATKERVRKVIEELNYRPNALARGVAVSRSRMIGVVVPDVSNFFYPKIIRGISDYLEKKDYSVIVCNSDYNPEKEAGLLMSLVDKRVDGVILCSGISNKAFLEQYRKYQVPLVLLGRTFDSSVSDASITGDNVKGSRKAATYLLRGGNRRIVYVEGNTELSGSRQRLQGYKEALREHGIEFDRKLTLSGEYSIEFGRRAAEELLEKKVEFDAIMTGSDLIAIGVVSGLLDAGKKIPEEIEVMGFDNIELAEVFRPALSTVSKPHYEMAQHLAKQMIRIIEGEEVGLSHMVVEPTLKLRKTTKARDYDEDYE